MMKSSFLFTLLATLGLSLALAVPSQAESNAKDDWEQIDDDDGIKVYKHDIPGQELPGFRGEVVIAASIDSIVAVLKDHTKHTEWMHKCAAAHTIKDLGNGRTLDYNRTDAPWPVWDRDTVLEAQWTFSADGKAVLLSFHNTESKLEPLPEKTVRMPRLVGYYKLWKLDDNKTKVVYQVEADPGGSLPTFLAKSIARDLPYHTLGALRARVTGKK